MTAKGRKYRSKVEVLRDFLEATHEQSTKSRIIGIANLNRVLFQRYLNLAVSFDLVAVTPRGYRLTARARPAIEAIDRYLARRNEAVSALHELRRVCHEGRGRGSARSGLPRIDPEQLLARPRWTEAGTASSGTPWEGALSRSGGLKPAATAKGRPEGWLDSSVAAGIRSPAPQLEIPTIANRARPRTLHRTGAIAELKRKSA